MNGSLPRPVLVTPLGRMMQFHSRDMSYHAMWQPLLRSTRCYSRRSKGDKATANNKIFTLRSINPSALNSCEDVRTLIKTQKDTVPDYFDVGFISGTMIISIHLKLTCESFGEKCEWGRKFYSAWCDSLRDKHSAIRKKNKVSSRQKRERVVLRLNSRRVAVRVMMKMWIFCLND